MRANGTGSAAPALVADGELARGLVAAERRGVLPSELWPALRQLLLTSADPQIAAVTTGLRALVQTREHYTHAYAALRAVLEQLPPPEQVDQVHQVAEQLALAAEELSSRAAALQQVRTAHAG